MERRLIFILFLTCFQAVLVNSTGGPVMGTETAGGVNVRNPKLLSFLRQFLRKPSSGGGGGGGPNSYAQKNHGDGVTNYNQYFTNADPYNQNQLLSNAATAGPIQIPSHSVFGGGGGGVGKEEETSESGINSMNSLFTKLIGDDTSSVSSIMSNILNLGTGSMENVLKRVNSFDTLKCIPRLLCQTVAQRQLDAPPPAQNGTKSRELMHNLHNLHNTKRDGKTIKFLGVETALEQFMAFLDLVQLKNWSLYPYLKGAYEGSQVKRLDECAERFRTCPFSDQQLVYYFNNYNGGFFQSLRSGGN